MDQNSPPLIAVPPEAALPMPHQSHPSPWRIVAGAIVLVGVLLAAAFVVLPQLSAGEPEGLVFDIPAGTARTIDQPTIDSAIEIPTRIHFRSGEPAVITVRNFDSVAHRAGPFIVGPEQTYIQRFPGPGEYPIACAVDPAESVIVQVDA